MTVKCFSQEHNAVPWPGFEPGPLDPESSALTIWPPRVPLNMDRGLNKFSCLKMKKLLEEKTLILKGSLTKELPLG